MVANSWDRPELRAMSVNEIVQSVERRWKEGSHGMAAATRGTSVATANAGASILNGRPVFCFLFRLIAKEEKLGPHRGV